MHRNRAADEKTLSPTKRVVQARGANYLVREFSQNGPKLITLPRFKDNRGVFMETYNYEVFRACGLPMTWHQDNLSESIAGVIRGMHFQKSRPQGKLIHCLKGMIHDVVIDLRPGPGFGGQYSVVLSADSEDRELFYVPAGFAHGFAAITDSVITYKCTTGYNKSDGGINPLECGITWKLNPKTPVTISNKDSSSPSWVDYAASSK